MTVARPPEDGQHRSAQHEGLLSPVARPPEDGQHRSAQHEGLLSPVARPPEDGQHRSAQGQGGPQTEHASAREVLVLLDDAAAGASLLVLSSALAQVLKRDLDLVFVENSRSLAAAALPFTQVLPHAGTGWVPLSPQDIEQGFRAHAARLRALAAHILPQRQVGWSLRVVRGNLDSTAAHLGEASDLVMLPAPRTVDAPRRRPPRRTVVAVAQDGDASTLRAQGIATQLAQALDGVLETRQEPGAEHAFAALATWVHAPPDLLVLPRLMASPRLLAERRCPLLLVG